MILKDPKEYEPRNIIRPRFLFIMVIAVVAVVVFLWVFFPVLVFVESLFGDDSRVKAIAGFIFIVLIIGLNAFPFYIAEYLANRVNSEKLESSTFLRLCFREVSG